MSIHTKIQHEGLELTLSTNEGPLSVDISSGAEKTGFSATGMCSSSCQNISEAKVLIVLRNRVTETFGMFVLLLILFYYCYFIIISIVNFL